MFKNNSYSIQACNYSFRQEELDKQNNNLSNYIRKDGGIASRLENIQKLMNRQYQLEMQNRKILNHQAQAIAKIQKQMVKLNKMFGVKPDQCRNSRLNSDSVKSCRTKRSTQKAVLHCIQQRKKVINQELSKRIQEQLQSKVQKKPLKFFMPSDQSIF